MTFPFDLTTFVVAAAVVGGAYVIFGISAFGAARSPRSRPPDSAIIAAHPAFP